MLRAHKTVKAGQWSGAVCDTVTLDFDARHRRRVALSGDSGVQFLLDLKEVPSLQEGDALLLEDGRQVAIAAAKEELLEIRAVTPSGLARLAWHLGNRHLPTQIDGLILRIRADHVIKEMLLGLGADIRDINAAFHPEGGAYGHGRTHSHEGAHLDHDHHPDQQHQHGTHNGGHGHDLK